MENGQLLPTLANLLRILRAYGNALCIVNGKGATVLDGNVGRILRRRRIALGLSQCDVERRTGIQSCLLLVIESERRVPRLASVHLLLEAYGLELVIVPAGKEPA